MERQEETTQAFRALFEQECGYVLASLRRLGVPERDCEDVGNEVFVRVHARLSDLDTSRSARPWLFAFCVRMASDYRRLKRNQVEIMTDQDATEPSALADEAMSRAEERALVLRALDALGMEKRAVFVLHDLDETPIPEVARALGIPEGTAYTRLRAARAEFTVAVRRDAASRAPQRRIR